MYRENKILTVGVWTAAVVACMAITVSQVSGGNMAALSNVRRRRLCHRRENCVDASAGRKRDDSLGLVLSRPSVRDV